MCTDLKNTLIGPLSPTKIFFNNEKIFKKMCTYLTSEDLLNLSQVSPEWEQLTSYYTRNNDQILSGSSNVFSQLMQRMEILDKIFSFLNHKDDRCSFSLVCSCFNALAKYRTVFSPVLADTTCHSMLQMSYDTVVTNIKVEDLYVPLPVDEQGRLIADFCTDRIKNLSFYEGVSAFNKITLLLSFPNLQALKYAWCSTFDFPQQQKDALSNLTTLHIQGIAQKDNDNLERFFSQAVLPHLTLISIELHFRRDLMLYMELHQFIANHHKTLQSLQLEFKCYFYPEDIRENAASMLVLLTNDLIQNYNKIVEKLKLVSLDTLIITFLDYEGTSMFHLGFTLLLAQKRLKILNIVKEFTKTRREFLPLYRSIQKNQSTLEDLSIPHPYNFNCSYLKYCNNLKSLTVGRIWGSRFTDSNVQSLDSLPTHKGFNTFRMSIRLMFTQIHWITQHLNLTELEFRGHHGELCTLNNIQTILRCQPSMVRLEYECEMTIQEYKSMKIYFKINPGIDMEWSHFDSADVLENAYRGEFQISIDRSIFRIS